MKRRRASVAILTAAAVLASVWCYVWLKLHAQLDAQDPVNLSLRPRKRSSGQLISLFANKQLEQEAFRIYHKQQTFEYKLLRSAIHPDYWHEAIAVEYDVHKRGIPSRRTTHRQRLVWDVFGPFYSCPMQERVGTPAALFDGGKWLCGVRQLLQGPDCIVYSFGSNGQVTFEQELIRMTHGACEVHIFDFSLTIEQVKQIQAVKGVTFHSYGIGATDQHVSDTFYYEGRNVSSYTLKSLATIMAELGHAWIDVLKMDIEGAEYAVLQAIVAHYKKSKDSIPVTQAQIEYHHFDEQPSRQDLLKTLTVFEKSGFRAFHQEYNYHGEAWHYIEYAYLHVDDNGRVVRPTRY